MILKLYKLENKEHICDQLQSVYQKIERMHELKKLNLKKDILNKALNKSEIN